MQGGERCLLDTGAWLAAVPASLASASLHNLTVGQCCAACLHAQHCTNFELAATGRCTLGSTAASQAVARGLVVTVSYEGTRPARRMDAARRLQQRAQRRSQKQASTTGSVSTTNASAANSTAGTSPAVWDTIARLAPAIAATTAALAKSGRRCSQPLSPLSRVAQTQVTSTTAGSAKCAPANFPRNVSVVCVAGGRPSSSLELIAAQLNGQWAGCDSPCVFDAERPLGRGWWLDAERSCYVPWELGGQPTNGIATADQAAAASEAQYRARAEDECVVRRGAVAVAAMAMEAARTCSGCGEPQRYETCFRLTARLVRHLTKEAVSPDTAKAAPASDGGDERGDRALAATWTAAGVASSRHNAEAFELVQHHLHLFGLCRRPCLRRFDASLNTSTVAAALAALVQLPGHDVMSSTSWRDDWHDANGNVAAPEWVRLLEPLAPPPPPARRLKRTLAAGKCVAANCDCGSDQNCCSRHPRVCALPSPPPSPPLPPPTPALQLPPNVRAGWLEEVHAQLRLGWLSAQACRQRAQQPRYSSQRFVSVVAAREQMHKNKFVVMDALYIARVLGRALIEPGVHNSRLGEQSRNRSHRLYLRHYWDLEPLCRRFDIVPLALYARHVRAGTT